MPHIHTEPNQHDHTASAFIIRTDMGEQPKLMLHMHRKIGKLLQAGGHIELHENPWEAISHELVEETGYNPSQLKILQPNYFRITKLSTATIHPVPICQHTHFYQTGSTHKHIDTVYAFVTNEPPNGLPHEGESLDIRWVTVDELKNLSPDLVSKIAQEIGVALLENILNEWVPVELTEFNK